MNVDRPNNYMKSRVCANENTVMIDYNWSIMFTPPAKKVHYITRPTSSVTI